MPITSRSVTRHSGEDVEVTISGYTHNAEGDIEEILFDPADFDCAGARVMDVFRAIDAGVKVVLGWGDLNNPILPLEGYGVTDLHKFNGLMNPEGGKIFCRVRPPADEEVRYFCISLELSKQRKRS